MAVLMQLKGTPLGEAQQSICSDSGNGGSAVAGEKKPLNNSKQKEKVPQRGLGVAQLEKIRLEEQQKNAASSSSNPGLLLTSFQKSITPTPLLDKTSFPISSPVTDLVGPSAYHLPERQYPPSSSICAGLGLHPKSQDTREKSGRDGEMEPVNYLARIPRRFDDSFSKSIALASSGLRMRRQQPLASLVNRLSSSSYPGFNLQTDSLLNECYQLSDCSMLSSRPKEERNLVSMVGMKRLSCESDDAFFSQEIPLFNSPLIKPGQLPLHGNFLMKGELKNKDIRGDSLSLTANQICSKSSSVHSDKRIKENGIRAYGGHLSLDSSRIPSIVKAQHSIQPSLLSGYPEFNSATDQGKTDEHISPFESQEQKPFYSFLPLEPNSRETNVNEASDSIDLDLKL